jgi:acyl-CoA synthetase (NDP forming)
MNKEEAKKLVREAAAQGRHMLLEPEAKALVAAWGIPVPRYAVIKGPEDVRVKAKELSPPFVLKVVSPDIVHKRDVGGVILSLQDSEEASTAVHEMTRDLKRSAPEAHIAGFLLVEMVPPGIELIVGGLRDPQFGPAVMFGTGGIAVELVKDVSFRLAPVSREEVFAMMQEVKSYPLLTGFRGSKPIDVEQLASAVMALSDILLTLEEVREIEINPLIVSEAGAVAVDARVVLSSPRTAQGSSTERGRAAKA